MDIYTTEKYESSSDTKRELDIINYKGLYKDYSDKGDLFLPMRDIKVGKALLDPVTDPDPNSVVVKAFEWIKEIIRSSDVHLGVISNGVHAIDYIHYNDLNISEWKNDKKVLIVYEAPSNNIWNSYGFQSNINFENLSFEKLSDKDKIEKVSDYLSRNDFSKISVKESLTRFWWRIDDGEVFNSDVPLQGVNSYAGFMWFLINRFGLSNVYATNLMRFELFRKDSGKEKFLNWAETQKIEKDKLSPIDIAYEEVFSKEVEAFKPDIILATANPYNYLINKDNFDYREKLYKIVHPANQHMADAHRRCCNVCQIAKYLCNAEIIEEQQAIEVFENYLNYDV